MGGILQYPQTTTCAASLLGLETLARRKEVKSSEGAQYKSTG